MRITLTVLILLLSSLLLAIIIVGIPGARASTNGVQCKNTAWWLNVSVSLALFCIGFSAFFSYKLVRANQPAEPRVPAGTPVTAATPERQHVVNLLVYDTTFFLYALVLLFWFVWNCLDCEGPNMTGGPTFPILACKTRNEAVKVCRVIAWVYIAGWVVLITGCICVLRKGAVASSSPRSAAGRARRIPIEAGEELETIMPTDMLLDRDGLIVT